MLDCKWATFQTCCYMDDGWRFGWWMTLSDVLDDDLDDVWGLLMPLHGWRMTLWMKFEVFWGPCMDDGWRFGWSFRSFEALAWMTDEALDDIWGILRLLYGWWGGGGGGFQMTDDISDDGWRFGWRFGWRLRYFDKAIYWLLLIYWPCYWILLTSLTLLLTLLPTLLLTAK